jgi:hypothetical protein
VQKTEEATRKIKVKETADNDLTAGQAAALLANERAVDKIREELEELEDTMQTSLRDSEAGRRALFRLSHHHSLSCRNITSYMHLHGIVAPHPARPCSSSSCHASPDEESALVPVALP